ncbi:MAG: hypothetical protein DWQ02_03420 [Bacteroidetes bacterium]|nr:MAG: hypothetical protein DWQ02_03420 [Bacteroidota bacterium]
MNRQLKRQLTTLLFLAIPFFGFAQLESLENLEEVTKKGFFKTHFKNLFKDFTDFGDPLTISGGTGLNLRSYSAYGGPLRQDPFFYSLNANVNFRVYRLNMPFSMIVTARNTESSLPNFKELGEALSNDIRDNIQAQRDRFVRFGMSPYYKWMKLHLGHRAMNFSKFTLANLNFYGAGTELTPGNWRLSAMYGRLAKAEPIDLSLVTPNLPIYQRIGWGAKFGYGTEQQSIDLMIFKAHDDPNSIFIPLDNPNQPSPKDNLTLGLNVQKLFFDRFRFRAETALSALSPNALEQEANESKYPAFLFTERVTTEHNSAVDASLDYEGEKFVAGVQFKRIDPNFNSLGAYFFNNDIVEYLGNLSFGLLEGKVNVGLSGGVQSNNLGLLKPTTTSRFVYSADISYSQEAFSGNLNYSNNTTDVGYVLNQELDSLNAVIITQNAGLNLNYTISGENENQHVFTLGGNIQEVGDDIENPLESATSQMIVGHFVYSLMLSESKWRLSARLNYNQNELAQMQTKRYGAGIGISKSFLEDKVNLGLDVNYYANANEIGGNSTNLTGQLRLGYNIAKGFSANTNWGVLSTEADNVDPFTEVTGNLGLQYSFNVQPFNKKNKEESEDDSTEDN